MGKENWRARGGEPTAAATLKRSMLANSHNTFCGWKR